MPPEMSNKEAIEMMTRCIAEMQGLKAQIGALSPKAEAYDVLHAIVGLLPQRTQGYSEDIIWVLRQRIKELTPKEPADAK